MSFQHRQQHGELWGPDHPKSFESSVRQPWSGDIWLHHSLGGRGLSCAVRVFSCSPGFCLLDAKTIPLPHPCTKKCRLPVSPWGAKSPRLKTTVLSEDRFSPSRTLLNGPNKQHRGSECRGISAVMKWASFHILSPLCTNHMIKNHIMKEDEGKSADTFSW